MKCDVNDEEHRIQAWATQLRHHYEIIGFDMDGTLVQTRSGKPFRENVEDWEIIAGRTAMLHALHQVRILIGLATNQGGVAFGYYSLLRMSQEIKELADALHIPWAHVRICYTHPSATNPMYFVANDPRRKPRGGMLREMAEEMAEELHALPPHRMLFVGDRPEDCLAAADAGASFAWAWDFFDLALGEEDDSDGASATDGL